MADFRIINQTLTDRPAGESDAAYIYQYIHVREQRPVALAAHMAIAAAAARRLFGTELQADTARTDALCRQMLLRNRYPHDVSSQIEMRLYATGEVRYECGEIFVHDGLAMRAVRPEAAVAAYDLPFGEAPTSARRAAHEVAMADARRRGFRSVIRCDGQGRIVTADDAPVFVVVGRRVLTPATDPSVERDRMAKALSRTPYTLSECDIRREVLLSADEVFYCDCRGVTALAGCGGRLYMDIIARAAAAKL